MPVRPSSNVPLCFVCPGRKPPFWAVTRPAHPRNSTMQNRFTVENAMACSRRGRARTRAEDRSGQAQVGRPVLPRVWPRAVPSVSRSPVYSIGVPYKTSMGMASAPTVFRGAWEAGNERRRRIGRRSICDACWQVREIGRGLSSLLAPRPTSCSLLLPLLLLLLLLLLPHRLLAR